MLQRGNWLWWAIQVKSSSWQMNFYIVQRSCKAFTPHALTSLTSAPTTKAHIALGGTLIRSMIEIYLHHQQLHMCISIFANQNWFLNQFLNKLLGWRCEYQCFKCFYLYSSFSHFVSDHIFKKNVDMMCVNIWRHYGHIKVGLVCCDNLGRSWPKCLKLSQYYFQG